MTVRLAFSFRCWCSLNFMSWRMQTIIRSSSSCSRMSLLCMLWLLTVCLAPGSRAQRLKEAEREKPAEKVPLMESDGVCYQEGCYAVFLQKKTFREAGRSCRERGGTLATIYNQEAAAVVHELLSAIETQGSESKLYLWIGLHRPPRQCSSTRPLRGFVWVTGKVSSFLKFELSLFITLTSIHHFNSV